MAAGLSSLLALPAAAHPGDGHDRQALTTIVALDSLVDWIALGNVPRQEKRVTSSNVALAFASCCCGQIESFVGCGPGMTCGSGSCGHGGVLAISYGTDLPLCANGKVVPLWQQVFAGLDRTPDDRPPRL
jgi:hypothetical protein